MSRSFKSLQTPNKINGYYGYFVIGVTENLSIPRLIYVINPTAETIQELYRYGGLGKYTRKSTTDDTKLQVITYSGRENILKIYDLLGGPEVTKELIEEFIQRNLQEVQPRIIPRNMNQTNPNPQEIPIDDGLPLAPIAIEPNYILSPTYVTINLNNGVNNLLDNSANYGRI